MSGLPEMGHMGDKARRVKYALVIVTVAIVLLLALVIWKYAALPNESQLQPSKSPAPLLK